MRTAERATTEAAVVYACAAGAVAQFVLSAYGRQKLGIGQATETRYGYIAIVLLAPAVAMVARPAPAPGAARRSVPRFVVVFADAGSHERAAPAHRTRPTRRTRELPVRSAILAAAQIANDPAQKLVPGCVAPSRATRPT